MARGTLDSEHSSLDTETFAQCWSLDETGNWKKFLQDDDGDGTWDLNQNRTANKANEITDVTESAGPSWVTPAYNAAGNMTTVPQPADPTKSYTATYDAWNRLVKLTDGASTVAEHDYDAARRRTIQKTYSGGTLGETRHLYYTEPSKWQVIEERVHTSTNPNRQFIWGLRYIDDLALRDRDTTGNGALDERLHGLQDANWNVTALIDSTGAVQERIAYTPYGVPSVLTPSFTQRPSSSYEWESLNAGYRLERVTSLLHVRHRVLNSSLGSWLQRDPLGLHAGVNLYQYVDSAPIDHVDPFGTVPWGKVIDVILCIVSVLLTSIGLTYLTLCLGLVLAGEVPTLGGSTVGLALCWAIFCAIYTIWTGGVSPFCLRGRLAPPPWLNWIVGIACLYQFCRELTWWFLRLVVTEGPKVLPKGLSQPVTLTLVNADFMPSNHRE